MARAPAPVLAAERAFVMRRGIAWFAAAEKMKLLDSGAVSI
jgi:hypothetical protein